MSYLGKNVAALTKASARRELDESGLVPTFPVSSFIRLLLNQLTEN